MFQGSVSLRATTITVDLDEVKQYLQNLEEDLEKLKGLEESYVCEGREKSPTVEEYLQHLNDHDTPIKHRGRFREHKVSRIYYKLRESLRGPFRKQVSHHREISPEETQKNDNLALYPSYATFPEDIREEPDQAKSDSLDHSFSRISRASRKSEESVLLSQKRSLSRYSSVIRYPSSVVEVYIGGDLFDNHSDFNRQFSFARPRSTNGRDDNYSMASLVIPGFQTVPIRRDSLAAFNASSRRNSRLYRHLSRTLVDIEQGSGSTSNDEWQPEREHRSETHSTGVYSLISDPISGFHADRPVQSPMGDEGSAPCSTRTFNYVSAFTNVFLGHRSQEALESSIDSDDEDEDDQGSHYSILQSPPHFHRDDSRPPHRYV
ncbi:hypothetical protein KL911_003886 [Ogataea haglerorum]|uniref:uncharacterized protein n=1 Tax=Ogataea haglerorum TaxID=1937702 RepID=UPI001C89793B|nr:uncharacterized protein KL911_003886 [Ogataea haglerorum]KAG7695372.1 hypothetical protein KL951_003814 [Ogataea haglerorum]KAG7752088.1 hypothetical protein KL911_003886 [Ogataea haglerorum]